MRNLLREMRELRSEVAALRAEVAALRAQPTTITITQPYVDLPYVPPVYPSWIWSPALPVLPDANPWTTTCQGSTNPCDPTWTYTEPVRDGEFQPQFTGSPLHVAAGLAE